MFTQREAPDTVLEREPGALVMCEHCYTVDGIDKGRFIKVSEWEGVRPLMRLPSSSGHPICTDLVSVGEDVHCESTAQEVHAGVPA